MTSGRDLETTGWTYSGRQRGIVEDYPEKQFGNTSGKHLVHNWETLGRQHVAGQLGDVGWEGIFRQLDNQRHAEGNWETTSVRSLRQLRDTWKTIGTQLQDSWEASGRSHVGGNWKLWEQS